MCPVCNTTLDQSSSPVARQIEAFISRADRGGRHEERDQGRLVAEYGPAILAAPPKHGLQPARVGAAVRRRCSAARSCSAGGVALEPDARRAGAAGGAAARPRARAAGRRGARPLRRALTGRLPVAFLAGFISIITPCVLPLVPGYLSAVSAVEAGRLGEPARRGGSRSRACPFIARLHGRLRRARRGRGGDRRRARDRARSTRSPASSSSSLGLAFIGLLPWPERLVAPGLLGERAGAARACCSAARSRSAPRRASARCSPRSSCSRRHGHRRCRARPARRVLARARRRRSCSPAVALHAGDGRLPLAPRPLRRDPDRRRRDARRARACSSSSTGTGG